jgi:hypothetical protein
MRVSNYVREEGKFSRIHGIGQKEKGKRKKEKGRSERKNRGVAGSIQPLADVVA